MSVILVAEQDAGYAERIAEVLRTEGWTAKIVNSRDAAFRAATAHKPILLLASATLPDSAALLAAFSLRQGGPGAVVLAQANAPAQGIAADYSADSLLTKPFSDDALKEVIRTSLTNAAAATARPSLPSEKSISQQLTSADIFGDVLAEVEAEASRSRPSSRARIRASKDEIERKLEETLSGVFPVGDKLLRPAKGSQAIPGSAAKAPPLGGRPKSPKKKLDQPSSSEIDDLLDKTLAGLSMPTRGRKTANKPQPAASTTQPPATAPAAAPVPAAPAPAAPVSTAPVPTAPVPTAPVPTAPVPTAPVPTAPKRPTAPATAPSPLSPAAPTLPPPTEVAASTPPAFPSAGTQPSSPDLLPTIDALPALDPLPDLSAPTLEAIPEPARPSAQALPRSLPKDEAGGATASDVRGMSPPQPEPLQPSIFSTTPLTRLPLLDPATDEATSPQEGLPTETPAVAGEDTNPWQDPAALALDPDPAGEAFHVDGADPWSEIRALDSPDSFGASDAKSAPGPDAVKSQTDSGNAELSSTTPPIATPAPPTTIPPMTGASLPATTPADSSQAGPSQASPSQAGPSQAGPSPEASEATNPWQSMGPPADIFPSSFDGPADPAPPSESEPSSPLDKFRSFLDSTDGGSLKSPDAAPASPAAAAPSAPAQPPSQGWGSQGSGFSDFASPPAVAETDTEGPEAALQGVLELRGESASGTVDDTSKGEAFGDYTLLERIAVGGMAEVWRARRSGVEGFQKTVAIKKILYHLTDSPDFINMFIDEAKLAAQLTHNNIIQIYDLGKVDDDFFIAMEYVDGRDLRTILKKSTHLDRSLPTHLALAIVAALARALDYAHRKKGFDDRALGLVHRDVSPQNVLISHEGEIKLCDFGIAKAVVKASTTQMGALKGKLQYMSPEQAWGQSVDARSDIFSLGSVLFEVLTGEKLFIGDSEIGVLESVRECRIRSVQEIVPDLPPRLDQIIRRALEKEPDNRYQTAGDMESDIQEVLRQIHPNGDPKDLAAYMASLFSPGLEVSTAEPTTVEPATFEPAAFASSTAEAAASTLAPPAAPAPSALQEPAFVEPPSDGTPPGGAPPTPQTAEKAKTKTGGIRATHILAIVAVLAILAAAGFFLTRPKSDSTPAAVQPSTVPAPATTSPATTPPPSDGSTVDPASGEAADTAAPGESAPAAPGDGTDAANDATSDDDEAADGATSKTPEELELEALVREGFSAQEAELQKRLQDEYDAKKKALEASLAEAQKNDEAAEPPPPNNND